MTEIKNKVPFTAWVDFNNPVFTDLDIEIRPLLARKAVSLNRELQIRTLLYTNFNNYLSTLLAKTSEDNDSKILANFFNTPEENRLELISQITKIPLNKITNDFINLFNYSK